MIRLIAADVDNTLVEEGTLRINPEYFEVIRALREKGVLFVAASGRNAVSISRLFAPVKDEIGMISGSGAVWWKMGEPHVISGIDYADILAFDADAQRIPGADTIAETVDKVYIHPGNEDLRRFLGDGYGTDVFFTEGGTYPADASYVKIAVRQMKDLEETTRDLMHRWEKKLHLCYAGGMWLDALAPGCNKGSALARIQEDLGISASETAAFGDNGNDLEMLALAGFSCAVASARPEVKAAADRVIGPWQEDSVLQEMKRILSEL